MPRFSKVIMPPCMSALVGTGRIGVVKADVERVGDRFKNAVRRKGCATHARHIQGLGVDDFVDDGILGTGEKLGVILVGDDGDVGDFPVFHRDRDAGCASEALPSPLIGSICQRG